jgi:Bifunctional DNA primase/polymerase, N-terminal
MKETNSLAKVWASITYLLDAGLSLIPVRDKQEGDRKAKTPYGQWKRYTTEKLGKEQLWHELETKNTTGIGIVCGVISGNLEVVDIDVKYKADAAILLFDAIEKFDPILFGKLRIHKTPSGGFHLLYRSIELIPGNQKLAGRLEDAKVINFLETRGEAGYVLAPPSLFYEVYRDVPIPLITAQDRNNLIAICRTLDEAPVIVASPYKKSPRDEKYYELNPWIDFNERVDPVDLLTRNGWIVNNTRNVKNIYFTRPGKNDGISMSFREDMRKYYCFTSSTEFEINKAYNPVSVLLTLEFNNDKKACHQWLVNNGFGKIFPQVEQNIAVNNAKINRPIQRNFSDDAVKLYNETKEQMKELFPYGFFIKYDKENNKDAISREAFYHVANNLGFRNFKEDMVRVKGNLIHSVTRREFQDALKEYIKDEDPDTYEKYCNIFEAFLQKNGAFTETRLQELDSKLILIDEKECSYKFYQNGYLCITADDIEFVEYSDNDLLIWYDSLQKRDYNKGSGGVFVDFVQKATINEDNVKNILGYLAHQWKDETTGFIIVLTESCSDPKMGGGSGKNVFCNLLRLTTSYVSKAGSQAKFDEKFFQSWNGERIFAISDAKKDFDFEFLKEPSTGGFIWKKLFKDEISVDVHDGPKFVVQTNYSFEVLDGGLRRRIKNIEFTDFFTKAGGIDVYYGKHFHNEWSEADFAGFDNYIAECIQIYLKSGRKIANNNMTNSGKQKQWEQTYGVYTCGFIMEYIDSWLKMQKVTNNTFKTHYDAYILENNISKNYQPTMGKINNALSAYAENNNLIFKKELIEVDFQGTQYKYRLFETLPF